MVRGATAIVRPRLRGRERNCIAAWSNCGSALVPAPMNFWRRFYSMAFGRPAPEDRKVFQIQLLLLFALSTLLYIGFPGTREWRRIAEENQVPNIIRGWDSLAWYTWLAAAPAML